MLQGQLQKLELLVLHSAKKTISVVLDELYFLVHVVEMVLLLWNLYDSN